MACWAAQTVSKRQHPGAAQGAFSLSVSVALRAAWDTGARAAGRRSAVPNLDFATGVNLLSSRLEEQEVRAINFPARSGIVYL